MKITDIIKGKVRNVSGDLLDEDNNYLIKVWGVRGADQPVDDQLTSFIVDAINEKLDKIAPTKYPKEAELICNQCNEFTTYENTLNGTMKITEGYTKEIHFCPHCFNNSCLLDIE